MGKNGGGGATYLAVFENDRICGGMNLVCSDNVYSWGLFFKPQTSSFLISACTFCFLNFAFLKTEVLNALVKNGNEQAIKFDKNFGFKEFNKDDKFTFLRQDKTEWQEHKSTKLMQRVSKISQEFKIKISA